MPQSLRFQQLWSSTGWRARASRTLTGLTMGAVVLSAAVFTAASPADTRSVGSVAGDVAGRALADVAEQAARPDAQPAPQETSRKQLRCSDCDDGEACEAWRLRAVELVCRP